MQGSKPLNEFAVKTMQLLRKTSRVKLVATAGIALYLFSRATQGSKSYQGSSPFDGTGRR